MVGSVDSNYIETGYQKLDEMYKENWNKWLNHFGKVKERMNLTKEQTEIIEIREMALHLIWTLSKVNPVDVNALNDAAKVYNEYSQIAREVVNLTFIENQIMESMMPNYITRKFYRK